MTTPATLDELFDKSVMERAMETIDKFYDSLKDLRAAKVAVDFSEISLIKKALESLQAELARLRKENENLQKEIARMEVYKEMYGEDTKQ